MEEGTPVDTLELRAAINDYSSKMARATDLIAERIERTDSAHETSIYIHAMQVAGTQMIAAKRQYMFLAAGIDEEELADTFNHVMSSFSDEDRENVFRG